MSHPEHAGLSVPTVATMDIEKRKHKRCLCLDGGVLRLAVRPEFRGRRGVLVDLSAGGIGFLLGDALDYGAAIVFELQFPAGGPMMRVARVRHCQPHPVPEDAPWLPRRRALRKLIDRVFGLGKPESENRAWLIGCEFDQPLREQEVTQFLAMLQAKPDDD